MEATVLSKSGKKSAITVPSVFNEEYRPDIIKKAVLAAQANRLQPYGPDRTAGTLSSAHSWGSGRGAAHVPRLTNGSRAAVVPHAKGGRAAHGPNPHRIYAEKINNKERLKAIRSAVAATNSMELVRAHGYRYEGALPAVIDSEIESLTKTKEVVEMLTALGFEADLVRGSAKTVRAGKGKMRGRYYKKKVGLLLVIAEDKGVKLAARNIPGVDVATLDELSVELLAPGTRAGRLTLWTEGAMKQLSDEEASK
ncbi:MAG TPA: 50S ribosomal protein L4 [Methanocella sp.]|nr:50S ribosomal protein L4 [Methanocella sp.]